MIPSRREATALAGVGALLAFGVLAVIAIVAAAIIVSGAFVMLVVWQVAHVFTLGRVPPAPWGAWAQALLDA